MRVWPLMIRKYVSVNKSDWDVFQEITRTGFQKLLSKQTAESDYHAEGITYQYK